jgi:hypothetical protein
MGKIGKLFCSFTTRLDYPDRKLLCVMKKALLTSRNMCPKDTDPLISKWFESLRIIVYQTKDERIYKLP